MLRVHPIAKKQVAVSTTPLCKQGRPPSAEIVLEVCTEVPGAKAADEPAGHAHAQVAPVLARLP
jgi:hypothetical protein